MPWVRFIEQFDWQPTNARWMISYGAGSVHLVKQVVADLAIKAGKAEAIERPKGKQDADKRG
jgi:predicted lipid carrier protein YhbT